MSHVSLTRCILRRVFYQYLVLSRYLYIVCNSSVRTMYLHEILVHATEGNAHE